MKAKKVVAKRPRCHKHYCTCWWTHCHDGWDRTNRCPRRDDEIVDWYCPVCRRVSSKKKTS